MESKLTLRLDKKVIDQIKIYAMRHKQSVSDLTEDLYKEVLIEKDENAIKSAMAKKYKGILGKENLDTEKIKYEYLVEKHIK